MVTLAVFYLFITYTRAGLAMRAAAQDLEIAETQGIDTRNIYRIAFFVAVLLAALAGALFFAQTYTVSPFMGERPLMVAFIVVILGGMGSIPARPSAASSWDSPKASSARCTARRCPLSLPSAS